MDKVRETVDSVPSQGQLSRDHALALLREWVHSDSLRRHCLAVEAAMRAQARERGGDEELWGLCSLRAGARAGGGR